jgi:hypothetical protein
MESDQSPFRLSAGKGDVLPLRNAILDGGIVCLGPEARRFYDLIRRRTPQHF